MKKALAWTVFLPAAAGFVCVVVPLLAFGALLGWATETAIGESVRRWHEN